MKTNGNASLPPWGELEGGCNGNASLPPWGELEGGQTLYDGENVIEMNKDLEELELELRRRVVRFWYRKKDGTLREATGTRCLALIPPEHHPNGTGHQPDFLVCYWDVERNHWRCFDRTRFIGFEEN